jgi:membrane protease YdiL (CAAX protease family)
VIAALVCVGRSPLPPVPVGQRVAAWMAGVPVLIALLGIGHLYTTIIRSIVGPAFQPPAVEITFLTVLLVCVQPAVIEELFFRYVAFGAVHRATGLHTTVWVTAVMFAAAHIYNPLGMPYLFLAGVVLGYARVWGGLALPVILHFLHNLAVLAIEGA